MKHGSIVKNGLILLTMVLFGCGGGTTAPPAETGKKAIVKISTSGSLPTGVLIRGVETEITLPEGLSVKSDSNGVLRSYYLSSSGGKVPTFLGGKVDGRKVTIQAAYQPGIAVGEFATLECDVAYNAPSPLGDFIISNDFKVSTGDVDVPLPDVKMLLTVTLP